MADNIRAKPGGVGDPPVSTDEVAINSITVHVPHDRILLGDRTINGGFWSATNPGAVKFVTAQHVIVDSGAIDVDTSALATAALQGAANTSLTSLVDALDVALSTRASETTLAALNTKIPSSPATDRTLATAPFAVRLADGSGFISTLPVSLASLPALATGSNTIGAVTQNGTWTTGVNSGAKIGTVPVIGTTARTSGFATHLVAATSACYPCGGRVHSKNASVGYAQVFNAASLPANGAVPDEVIVVSGNNGASLLQFPPIPTNGYGTGLVVALSTTQATLTIIGTSDALIVVHFFPAQV